MLHKTDFHRAGLLTAKWILELPITLGVLYVATFASNQYFEYLAQELNGTEQGPWPAQVCEVLSSFVLSFALLMIGGYFLVSLREKMSAKAFLAKYTGPLTAESLRAITRMLLWALALIIPGVVMYCRLTFVPIVVFGDPDYFQHNDAVARSMALTKSCWIRITLFVLVLGAFDAVFELAPNLLKIENLVVRAAFDLCGFVFSLFAFVLLYIIFENLRFQGARQASDQY